MRDRGFDVLKILAIIEVACAHFLEPRYPLVWAPTAVALLGFAYSSAYFTARGYGTDFDLRQYWRKKILRIGPRLLAVDLLLLALFLVQGRSGIWTWQSAVCAAGMQGWLSWFWLPNPSPFGRGMWFLTLLFVFYAVYPGLVRLVGADRRRGGWIVLGWCAAAWGMQSVLPYGHALWLTTCGFVIGTWAGRFGVPVSPRFGVLGLVVTAATALALNGAGIKGLNFPLLLGLFGFVVAWWHGVSVPAWLERITLPFAGCLLEIYLLHTYLFVHPTGNLWMDLVLSLVLVLAVAKTLDGLVVHSKRLLPPKPEPARTP